MKENPTEYRQFPGETLWEQVKIDGEHRFVFYRPPNDVSPDEAVSYDTTNPGEVTEEYSLVYKPLAKCPWPLAGEIVKPSEDIWDEVHGFIYRHADLPDERLYDVVTAWIFCTWILERWISVPYLHLIGPKKSGKTRLLEVLQSLCYRGLLSASTSEAALYRCIEEFHPTLLLDESEIYNADGRSAVQNILNSGYRRGQVVMRTGKNDEGFSLDFFEVFGFKALAGTGGFKDTLESRSIRISMEKNIRPVEDYVDTEKAEELRSMLLYWRFQRLGDMGDVSDVSAVSLRVSPPELAFCDGRHKELFTPLVTLSNHGRANIVSYAKDSYALMADEESNTEEAQVVLALLDSYGLIKNGFIPTASITDNFNTGLSDSDKLTNRGTGWTMKRLGFNSKRRNSTRGWIIDPYRMKRLCARYGLTKELRETISLLETTETTQTSISEGPTPALIPEMNS